MQTLLTTEILFMKNVIINKCCNYFNKYDALNSASLVSQMKNYKNRKFRNKFCGFVEICDLMILHFKIMIIIKD